MRNIPKLSFLKMILLFANMFRAYDQKIGRELVQRNVKLISLFCKIKGYETLYQKN